MGELRVFDKNAVFYSYVRFKLWGCGVFFFFFKVWLCACGMVYDVLGKPK